MDSSFQSLTYCQKIPLFEHPFQVQFTLFQLLASLERSLKRPPPPFFWLERSHQLAQAQASQGFSRFSCSRIEDISFIKLLTISFYEFTLAYLIESSQNFLVIAKLSLGNGCEAP